MSFAPVTGASFLHCRWTVEQWEGRNALPAWGDPRGCPPEV